MTIALTGATGSLGRLVIDELLARDVPSSGIVAIVRAPAKAADLANRGVVIRQGDYTDPTGWVDALRGVDKLLLISVSGAGASAAHRTVIDAAATSQVGFLAYTSILNADRTANPLAPEHLLTERLIEAAGIPHAILRNAWYHELYTRLLPQYLATGEVVGSTGEGRISGAARADFAAAAAAVLTDDDVTSRIYELGGPAFTLGELAATLAEVVGRPIVHRNLADADYVAELRAAGMGGAAQLLADADASIRAGDMETTSTALAPLAGRELRPLVESLLLAL